MALFIGLFDNCDKFGQIGQNEKRALLYGLTRVAARPEEACKPATMSSIPYISGGGGGRQKKQAKRGSADEPSAEFQEQLQCFYLGPTASKFWNVTHDKLSD